MIKSFLKKIIPETVLLQYHSGKSKLAALRFGNPSRNLTVIGITGTKGKSTTANFVWSVLQKNGIQTGLVGTANIRIGETEYANTSHMTMPGPFEMQQWFRKMIDAGCEAVVLEVTSEGIKQHRHENIDFNIGLFTNLSPEHLPSHNNSFDEYKATKKRFFTDINAPETIIVNIDNQHSEYYLECGAITKKTTSLENNGDINADIISITSEKTDFKVDGYTFSIGIGGNKNVENALLAVAIGKEFNLNNDQIQSGFSALSVIPGRMERIDEGQDFDVFVDYAHEELSMTFLTQMGKEATKEKGKSIVLLGAEGGGRDPRKRAIMGKIAAQNSDIVIVSNVDPYEDDPTPICEEIAISSEKNGKIRGENLFVIEDRRSGIAKALELATKDDIVFITGKGSEQTITIGGKSTPWDDRVVVREELKKI